MSPRTMMLMMRMMMMMMMMMMTVLRILVLWCMRDAVLPSMWKVWRKGRSIDAEGESLTEIGARRVRGRWQERAEGLLLYHLSLFVFQDAC